MKRVLLLVIAATLALPLVGCEDPGSATIKSVTEAKVRQEEIDAQTKVEMAKLEFERQKLQVETEDRRAEREEARAQREDDREWEKEKYYDERQREREAQMREDYLARIEADRQRAENKACVKDSTVWTDDTFTGKGTVEGADMAKK